MFRHRWQVAWFIIWLIGGSLWATVLIGVAALVRPFHDFGDLADFFLLFGTLPIVASYIAGLVVGWTLSGVRRGLGRVRRKLVRRAPARDLVHQHS